MSADPALTAALALNGAMPFLALKMELPGKTLRLLDGSGAATIGGETYTGFDEDYGMLTALEQLTETLDNEAPEIRFVFQPDDVASAAALASPDMQGSKVTLKVGCLNPATGTPIGTPETIFLGVVDVPTRRIAEGVDQIEITAVSVFELLFEVNEGERASDGFHQSIFPGELGLQFMTGTTDKLWWGANPPGAKTGGGGSPGAVGGGREQIYRMGYNAR